MTTVNTTATGDPASLQNLTLKLSRQGGGVIADLGWLAGVRPDRQHVLLCATCCWGKLPVCIEESPPVDIVCNVPGEQRGGERAGHRDRDRAVLSQGLS